MTGQWGYIDNSVSPPVNRNVQNYLIEVWDKDQFNADQLITAGLTDGLGVYAFCFNNDDSDGGLCCWGGQDVYLKFISANSEWVVQDTTAKVPYTATTSVVSDLADGSTKDFGSLQPGDPNHMGATAIFDFVNRVWNWKPGACWDQTDTTCRKMVINWRFDTIENDHYAAGDDQVLLSKNAHKFPDLVMHEAAHAIMDDVYENNYPDAAACGKGHKMDVISSPTCGWAEGFASWVPLMVHQNSLLTMPNSSGVSITTDMELPGWHVTIWDNGSSVEGRVAAALWDIADVAAVNETWDRHSDLPSTPTAAGRIWETFVKGGNPQTFDQFWAQRKADPTMNTAPTGALASIYHNTIDISFRDPLTNNVAVQRPTPFHPHNFSFNTTTQFWSVVGVLPPSGTDYDLNLFDDQAQVTNLKKSAAASGQVDFVVIDSNKHPLGDFYPQVFWFNNTGSGFSTVELAQGSQILAAGTPRSIAMTGVNLFDVWDLAISNNTTASITISTTSGTFDAYLFSSATGGNIKSRSQAAATVTGVQSGSPKTLTFPPGATGGGWHGLVIVRTSGSGTVTLNRTA